MTPAQLRHVLKDLELNPSEFARLLKVNRSTVSRWLDGSRPIRPAIALLIEGYVRAKRP